MSRLKPQREVLDNGVVLLWNQRDDTSSVAVRGMFSAGAAREAPAQAGLAGLTARLLRRGTEQRSAQELSAAVEDLGASFAVSGSTEEAGFSAKCLGRDLGAVLQVLGEVLQYPSFEEREIEKTREEVFTQLREQDDSTRAQADLKTHELLYPAGHPYARAVTGTRDTIAALGREDLRSFHGAYYRAADLRISVAGSLNPEIVRRKVGAWFQDMSPAPPLPALEVEPSGKAQRTQVPMPHKSQVDLVIAAPGINRLHPDFYALTMVNLILGSLGLMGRLGERVREQQGMAYYVYSQVAARTWAGEWMTHAGVAPKNVEVAIAAIVDEVTRIRAEQVTEAEFADACDYLIGSMPLRLETNDGISGYLLNCEYYNLGLDYIDRYPGYIRKETRETLLEAAQKYLDPSRFTVVTAGPVSPS